MLQPPGVETFALPYLASIGPRTKIPALIVLTKLYEAKVLSFFLFFIEIKLFFFEYLIDDPIDTNSLIIVSISFTFGRFFKIIFLFDKIVAAKIGNDAFFDPEI